ncbi:MAG: hypothetical protein KDA54_22035, partial [Phycisphaerales bacterium]|nr:hypothetical protein [Phycisphaerales bacterium]
NLRISQEDVQNHQRSKGVGGRGKSINKCWPVRRRRMIVRNAWLSLDSALNTPTSRDSRLSYVAITTHRSKFHRHIADEPNAKATNLRNRIGANGGRAKFATRQGDCEICLLIRTATGLQMLVGMILASS